MIHRPDELNIVDTPSYVIIGAGDHGQSVSTRSVRLIRSSLADIVALKMEGEPDMDGAFSPMSVEATVMRNFNGTISYFPDTDGSDIRTKKLLEYEIPARFIELALLVPYIRYVVPNPRLGINEIEAVLERLLSNCKKNIFGAINFPRARNNFRKIVGYIRKNPLDLDSLSAFKVDVDEFLGAIREYEWWRGDLEKFRAEYPGKIGVSCGAFHVDFVRAVLEGFEILKPANWSEHLDHLRYGSVTKQQVGKENMVRIYQHIDQALA